MRLPLPCLLLLSICLVVGNGCRRKNKNTPSGATTFSPEIMQQLTEAERSPQASLELLNELLKDWVLTHSTFPNDLQEFVTKGALPRLPVAPPGKKFVIDPQRRSVVLADQ